MSGSVEELLTSRRALIQELTDHENKRAEQLSNAVRAANSSTGGVVIVKPISSPDRSHNKATFTLAISGQSTLIMSAVESDEFATRGFVEERGMARPNSKPAAQSEGLRHGT